MGLAEPPAAVMRQPQVRATKRSPSFAGGVVERCDALFADSLSDTAKLFGLLTEPCQFVAPDAVVFRVAAPRHRILGRI